MRRAGLLFLVVCLCGVPGGITASAATISTVAGGGPDGVDIATALVVPRAIFLDASGSLFIASQGQGRIFRVDPGGQVTVAAGSGVWFFSSDGVPATQAALFNPEGFVRDAAGNMFIADTYNHRIRRVDAATGLIQTVAGTGVETGSIDREGGDPSDDLGDGGQATAATLRYPSSVALDPGGNLVISDGANHRIRRVDSVTGIISTIIGTGAEQYNGDGIPAQSATLAYPHQILYDVSGDLLIADTVNNRVRRVSAATGLISTVAGNGSQGGTLGDGGPAVDAALNEPVGISLDGLGRLLIADTLNQRIRRVDLAGTITTVAGNGLRTGYLDGSGYDPADDVLEGVPATETTLNDPMDVIEDSAGNLLIADDHNNRIRRVDGATGLITSFSGDPDVDVGDGGPATRAFTLAVNVAADPAGNFFIADYFRVRRVDATTHVITTVSGCIDPADCTFDVEGLPGTRTGVSDPMALAVDTGGNLFIAGRDDRVVRVDASTGIVTFFAGNGSTGWYGDGGPARLASIGQPVALAFDQAGNLYIGHQASNSDPVVRRVDAITGIITTVAGGGSNEEDGGPAVAAWLRDVGGLAVDSTGNLYVAEPGRNRIRRVDAATGIITTIAGTGDDGFGGDGGPAAAAILSQPSGLDIDSDGNLLIADKYNLRVRKIDLATGIITTVAGNGLFGFEGNGGEATQARLAEPSDVAALQGGDFLIADYVGFHVRLVSSATAPPVADAGADFSVACSSPGGTPVTLDGSGSTGSAGAALTYVWTGPFPEGGGTVTGVRPAVTLPPGRSSISLVVSEGLFESAPDTVDVTVTVDPVGLKHPLAALVPEGQTPPLPKKTFKSGAILVLRLQLPTSEGPLTDRNVAAPRIVAMTKNGVAVPLPAKIRRRNEDPGALPFKYAGGGDWVFSLRTRGLAPGTYVMTIEMPDGRRWQAAFVMR